MSTAGWSMIGGASDAASAHLLFKFVALVTVSTGAVVTTALGDYSTSPRMDNILLPMSVANAASTVTLSVLAKDPAGCEGLAGPSDTQEVALSSPSLAELAIQFAVDIGTGSGSGSGASGGCHVRVCMQRHGLGCAREASVFALDDL